ncbi:MAG: cytochrome c biogenesis protein CcdA, partial [Actinomycetota bacterium]|nr:cytochrome c biogenesis protein CcdA [Actinomycetota bacterium]
MTGVGLAGAFLGGLASLLSPCSALLLPSFFAYAFDRLGLLVRRTVAFWAGLCLVLVPLGAGVGAVGDAVTRHRTEVTVIGGIV